MVNFRKRVKIAPGVTLNFSKSGVSTTIGPRGANVNIGKRGAYLNTGIPGTGIYSRKKLYGASRSLRANESRSSIQQVPIRSKAANQAWGSVFLLLGVLCFILGLVSPLHIIGRIFVCGIGVVCLFACVGFFLTKSLEDYEQQKTTSDQKQNQRKIEEAKSKVVLPKMRQLPEYNDQPSASAAFDIACLNYGLANTIDEVFTNNMQALDCLKFAKIPLDESWGSNDILAIYDKMYSRADEALIRIAMNIRYAGGEISDIREFIHSEDGKKKWDSIFS